MSSDWTSSPSAQDGLSPRSALPRFTLGSVLWYLGSLVNRILRFGQSFNSMKVTRCFHFFSSTSGQRKTCVSGFKSLIKSFIHRPACWRKVRENKLSHRVLFKLSDPFQHALPASLFVCVWGLGWGGREGKKKSWWHKAHGTTGTFPKQPPPGPQPAFVGTGVCQSVPCARTHTHTLHNTSNKMTFQQLCSQVPLYSEFGTLRFLLTPASPGFASQQAGQVPVFKSPFNHSLLFRNAKPWSDFIDPAVPGGGGCWGFLRILQWAEELQEPFKLQEGFCPLCSSPRAIEKPQKESVYHSRDHTGWLPLLLLCTFLHLKTSLLACLGAEIQCHAWLALSFDG